jgi:hypothetical protein
MLVGEGESDVREPGEPAHDIPADPVVRIDAEIRTPHRSCGWNRIRLASILISPSRRTRWSSRWKNVTSKRSESKALSSARGTGNRTGSSMLLVAPGGRRFGRTGVDQGRDTERDR